ncbi:VWA domain-containing protein [Crenobacter sp. SG2305]|uniref:cobaltochelatase CobT-related protein n=1 Tax=Crenobacter oryzisoli TaxID=3056844 RepID=UPI0025AA63EA|nr:VWA domain-containing protein [Crenobacter sp. SG2305]MDN0082503.1 VWA domain-containing protein [Crenobacter sp. SG2305]
MKGIIESLPIVAGMLAEQTGIKLTISGNDAYTDGEVINLPLMPASGEGVGTLAFGYLCHEAAHIRYTAMEAMASLQNPLECRILNILEDPRIEHRLMLDFPGAKYRLENLSRLIDNQVHSCEEHIQNGPARLFCNHLLNQMIVSALGRDWVEQDWLNSRAAFCQTFGEATLIKLESITAGTHLKPSTYDLIPVVKSLMQALKDAQEEAKKQAEEQEQEDQSTDQDSGDADQSDDDPGNADADHNAGDQGDAGQQPPSGGDADDAAGSDAGDPAASKAGDPSDDDQGQKPDHQAIADALDALLGATADEFGDDRIEAVKSALGSETKQSGQPRVGMMQTLPADTTGYCDYAASRETSESIRALRNRIRALLQSESKTRHRYLEQGSRLAGSRLSRLECGKTDVFRHTTTRKGVDTAISLLVDQSGSMAEYAGVKQRYQVACDAAFAIAESVEGLKGISLAVNAFPYEIGDQEQTAEIKGFDVPLRKSQKAFSTIQPQGYTPLAESMMAVGAALYRRPEHRKILILATDGDPDDQDATHEAVRQLAKLGIELVAIGIQTDTVRKFFSDHLVIRQVQELPQELFGVLSRLLLSNRH